MANQDLFKQAIAEAKSVREAAIINAKEALEETLTPHLKELLAAKLQEMDMADDEEVVNEMEDDEMEEMAGKKGNFEKNLKEADDDEEAEDDSDESEDEAEEEGEVEAEEEEEEIEVKDMEVEDLKNLIRDIVAQEMGGSDEEMPADDDMNMDAGMDMDAETQPQDMMGTDDEEINLEELLAELEQLAEADEDTMDEARKKKAKEDPKNKKEEEKAKEDLKEALKTIKTLRTQLSEVNLLNAKLLYLNKVFRSNNLTESQKVTVITSFDKAVTVNEVKLVYETVKQSFVGNKPKKSTIKENKGFASAPSGHSTKPIITEVNEQVLRMQKLAGIIR